MRKVLLSSLAAGVLAAWSPGAHAVDAGYQYRGGCGFTTVNHAAPAGATMWTGNVQAFVVATDFAGSPVASPVSVACELRINGVTRGNVLSASGTGATMKASPFSYTASLADVISLCEHVVVGGNATVRCDGVSRQVAGTTVDAADPLDELVTAIWALVNSIFQGPVGDLWISVVDPLVCPLLAALAPGIPGVVDITPQGDAFIAGDRDYDCPPYGF